MIPIHKIAIFSILIVNLRLTSKPADAHGRLSEPPARNTLWRFGYKAQANYNDNELFCGGIGGITRNEGKCGVCGDPYDGPRLHETGNQMAQNETVRNYFPGSSIDLMIEIVANHGGHFNFEVCWRDSWDTPETEDCFETLKVSGRNESDPDVNAYDYELDPEKGTGTFTLSVDLPFNKTCENCILRWHWRSANNWGICDDGTEAIGCGYQEIYRNCADISIKRNGSGVAIEMAQTDDLQLLTADPSKYVTLPIQNEKLWRKYQTSLDWFWTVYEVNLERDKFTIGSLSQDQRLYVKKVLAFMLIWHNTITTKELFLDLVNQVEIKEASYFFGSQADSKKTHKMLYSMALDELTDNNEQKIRIMSDVANLPEVRAALRWYIERINLENESFAKRLLTFSTLQGIMFNVTFIIFSWIENQHPSMMHGLMKGNQLVWRDERLNLSLATMLFEYIDDKVGESEAIEIIKTAVQHAKNIFTIALPCSIVGLDCHLLEQFIEHQANALATSTNHERLFKVEKPPFDWIVEPKIEVNESMAQIILASNDDEDPTNFDLDGDF